MAETETSADWWVLDRGEERSCVRGEELSWSAALMAEVTRAVEKHCIPHLANESLMNTITLLMSAIISLMSA